MRFEKRSLSSGMKASSPTILWNAGSTMELRSCRASDAATLALVAGDVRAAGAGCSELRHRSAYAVAAAL